jgi:RNA polymerase sigma-70 factor (ECF subfamily)
MQGKAMTEHELVAGCERGDRDAQRALYEQTSERVFRLLLRMTRSREVAEDLVQETYLKAFAAVASFDARCAVSTWLYRIAVNEALQWLRRKTPVALDPDAAARRPDPRNNGHEVAIRMDVDSAMAALDPMDRAVLLLRYQEGLDYLAIADVAQIAMGTVASRLNRARERLRALLADFSPNTEENVDSVHRISHGWAGSSRAIPPVEDRT